MRTPSNGPSWRSPAADVSGWLWVPCVAEVRPSASTVVDRRVTLVSPMSWASSVVVFESVIPDSSSLARSLFTTVSAAPP